MTIDYRRAVPEDSAFIEGVVGHPLVRQNNPDSKMFCRWLQRYMVGDHCHDGLCHTHFVVRRDGRPVGHIAEYLYRRDVRCGNGRWGQLCYLGFDVHPDYWGQGIMKSALRLYMQDGFAGGRFKQLVAECRRDNLRSKRLLEGLGFRGLEVGPVGQFLHMWQSKGLGLKVRYACSQEQWAAHEPR